MLVNNPRISEDLETRKSNLDRYIKAKQSAGNLSKALNDIKSSPDAKLTKLSDTYKNGTPVAIDGILGNLYRQALPYDDPLKNISDGDAAKMVHDFINWRTDGKDSEFYIREALKKNESVTLEGILSSARNLIKDYYSEAAKNLGEISIDNIGFNPNDSTEELNKISGKLEFDDIAQIIQDNVQDTIERETEKAEAEQEAISKLEEDLSANESVIDEASLEKALQKYNVKRPKVYQPSLFEAVFMSKMNKKEDGRTEEDAFNEAVEDYTMFSMMKALKLEKFDKYDVKKLTDEYSKM